MSQIKPLLHEKRHAPFVPFATINGKNPKAQRIVDLKTQLDLGLHKNLVTAMRNGKNLNAVDDKKNYVYKTDELRKAWGTLTEIKSAEQFKVFTAAVVEEVKHELKADPKNPDPRAKAEAIWVEAYTQAGATSATEQKRRDLITCVGRALAGRTNATSGDLTAAAPRDAYYRGGAATNAQTQKTKSISGFSLPITARLDAMSPRMSRFCDRVAANIELVALQTAHGGALGVAVGHYGIEFVVAKIHSRKVHPLNADFARLNAKVGELNDQVAKLHGAVTQKNATIAHLNSEAQIRHREAWCSGSKIDILSSQVEQLKLIFAKMTIESQQLQASQTQAYIAYKNGLLSRRSSTDASSTKSSIYPDSKRYGDSDGREYNRYFADVLHLASGGYVLSKSGL